jgi:hypothetical protein
MPTETELDDLFSKPPQIRKAAIRRVLDELVALGLIEVRTDQHGEQRYYATEYGKGQRRRL